jgi:hypothetical protein
MIKKSPVFLILFFVWAWCPVLSANDKKSDAGLWTTIGVSPAPTGKWKMLFSLEHRSREHFRETSLWCGSMNVYYTVTEYLKLGAGYEFYLNKEEDGGYTPEHRYYPEGILSYAWGQFSANLRIRMMNTFTQWNDPCWETRNRLKLGYSIKGTPLKPFVYTEPYHEIQGFRFQKIRYAAGCSYVMHSSRLDIYYMRENYQSKPFLRHIIGIDYIYSF